MIQNKELKRRIIEISYNLKLGHIGSCLTAVDIIKEIYDTMNPRDLFVLSAGHAHLAHVVIDEEIYKHDPTTDVVYNYAETTIKNYGIHCDKRAGCDVSTGSLGHGIGIAVGMALADKSKNVYCLLSDGELAEGSVWEILRIRQELDIQNLMIYINFNGWGAYREVDNRVGNQIYSFLTVWDISKGKAVNIKETNMNDYPKWLQGQIAHYKVLDEKEYEELLEVLK
jgi:transketolase N-terminal domain/subunit